MQVTLKIQLEMEIVNAVLKIEKSINYLLFFSRDADVIQIVSTKSISRFFQPQDSILKNFPLDPRFQWLLF